MPRLAWGKFHFGDWLNDVQLRQCSPAARGIWIDMLAIMHQAEPRGYLKAGPKVILPDNLHRNTGDNPEVVRVALAELAEVGIYSTDETGCIFSRRMVRDEEIRRKRAAGGKLGGNPALMPPGQRPAKVNLRGSEKVKPESESESEIESQREPEAAGADGVFLKLNPRDGGRPADLSFDTALLQAIPDFQEMWKHSMNIRKNISAGSQQLQIDEFAKFCVEHGAAAAIAVLVDANLGSYKKPVFKDPNQGNGHGGHREMRSAAGAHEGVEQPGFDKALLAGMVASLKRCKRDGLTAQAYEIQAEIDGYRSRHHLTGGDEAAG